MPDEDHGRSFWSFSSYPHGLVYYFNFRTGEVCPHPSLFVVAGRQEAGQRSFWIIADAVAHTPRIVWCALMRAVHRAHGVARRVPGTTPATTSRGPSLKS